MGNQPEQSFDDVLKEIIERQFVRDSQYIRVHESRLDAFPGWERVEYEGDTVVLRRDLKGFGVHGTARIN
jgi:hypothetical protein